MKGVRIIRVGITVLNDSQVTCEQRHEESGGLGPANN